MDARLRSSNVWIATAQVHDEKFMKLVALRPVQDLPGNSHPFERLVGLLAGGEYCAAGVDAPFALPERHMPVGGFPELLRDVAKLPTGGRPFAEGKELKAYGERNAHLLKNDLKPLRTTEEFWKGRVANVRSTLQPTRNAAPRPSRSFDSSKECETGGRKRCSAARTTFPAAQLHHWELPHQGYDGPKGRSASAREEIIEGISPRIEIPDDLRKRCQESADALDSVLCLFAARAAAAGLAPVDDPTAAELEGWIAVHPHNESN